MQLKPHWPWAATAITLLSLLYIYLSVLVVDMTIDSTCSNDINCASTTGYIWMVVSSVIVTAFIAIILKRFIIDRWANIVAITSLIFLSLALTTFNITSIDISDIFTDPNSMYVQIFIISTIWGVVFIGAVTFLSTLLIGNQSGRVRLASRLVICVVLVFIAFTTTATVRYSVKVQLGIHEAEDIVGEPIDSAPATPDNFDINKYDATSDE